jgi:hypothetical protein
MEDQGAARPLPATTLESLPGRGLQWSRCVSGRFPSRLIEDKSRCPEMCLSKRGCEDDFTNKLTANTEDESHASQSERDAQEAEHPCHLG